MCRNARTGGGDTGADLPHTQGLKIGFLHHGTHAEKQLAMSTPICNRYTLPVLAIGTKGGAPLCPRSWCRGVCKVRYRPAAAAHGSDWPALSGRLPQLFLPFFPLPTPPPSPVCWGGAAPHPPSSLPTHAPPPLGTGVGVGGKAASVAGALPRKGSLNVAVV